MRQSLWLCIFLLYAVGNAQETQQAGFCQGDTVITKISNDPFMVDHHLYGGMNGGTRLYIEGTGFDCSDSHTNQVYVGSIHCPVDTYYTTCERIVCEIEKKNHAPQRDLTVVVKACGKIAECNNNDCTLNIEYDRTPMMHNVVPQANFAGDAIGVTGVWRASNYSDLKEVRISERNCLISEEDIESSHLSWWGTAKINCQIPEDMESGYHKITVTSQKGTGFSQDLNSADGFKVGHESTVYNVRIHPKIENLSSQKGFTNGQKLTIKGRGFGSDVSKINVKVGDKNCKVLKAFSVEKQIDSENQEGQENQEDQENDETEDLQEPEKKIVVEEFIECVIDKFDDVPTDKVYKGGAGLSHLKWKKNWTNWEDIMDGEMKSGETVYPATKSVMLSAENYYQEDQYTQYARGIFRSTEKGTYKFRISADDDAALYLSTSPVDVSKALDFENDLSKKCYIDGHTGFRDFHNQNHDHLYCEYELDANTDYYILLFQTEGWGGDHLSLTVTTPNTDASKPNTSPNVQEIKVNYTPVRKEYTIKVMGLASASFVVTWSDYNTEKQSYDYLRNTRDIPISYNAEQISYELRRANGVTNEVTKQSLKKNGSPAGANDDVYGFLITVKQTMYWTRNLSPVLTSKDLIHIDDPDTNQKETDGSIVLEETVSQSAPVDGQFRLKYGDFVSENIKWYYSSYNIVERLQKALELSGGISGYTLGSKYDGYTWRISFDSVKGDAKPLEFESELCTDCDNVSNPGKLNLIINHKFQQATNELVYLPVPSDMLFSYSNKPQVVVDVDGNLAGCIDGICDYEFFAKDQTPVVESFDFATTPGKLVVSLKHGYQDMVGHSEQSISDLLTKENLEIRFGNVDCPITKVNKTNKDQAASTITCNLPIHADNSPDIEAGSWKPMVHLKEHGYFLHEDGLQDYDRTIDIDTISPSVGSTGGGTLITIEGKGFANKSEYNNSNTITIDGQSCEIKEFSSSQVKCETPEMTGNNENVELSLTVNNLTKKSNLFKYSDSVTPKITSLNPHKSSPVLKKDLIIQGTGFDNDKTKFTVWLKPVKPDGKEYLCNVVSSTTTEITCRLSGGKSGEYLVKVHQTGVGYSKPANTGDNKFEYIITVSSVSPSSGSQEGGTILTITGTNFSTVLKENQVVLGESGSDHCIILTATPTELTCRTNKPLEPLSGPQTVYVLGRAQEEAVCDPNASCKYTFDPNKTHVVKNIATREAVKDSTIVIEFTKAVNANSNIEVSIGGKKSPKVEINSQDRTKVSFDFPELPESSHVPVIHFVGEGYAQLPTISESENDGVGEKFIEILSKLQFSQSLPASGGWYGNKMTIQGNGFPAKDQIQVKVGGRLCNITEFSESQIKCEFFDLWKINKENSVTVEVLKNNKWEDLECENCKYTTSEEQSYMNALADPIDTTNLDEFKVNFTGSNLFSFENGEAYNTDNMVVKLVASESQHSGFEIIGNKTFGPGQINAKFPEMMAGNYIFRHYIQEVGYSINNNNAIDIPEIKPIVNNISPVESSLLGGTELVITGKGFPTNENKHLAEIFVGNQHCQITESKWDEIKCLTPIILTKAVQEDLKIFKPTVQRDAIQTTGWLLESKVLIDENINTYTSGQDLTLDFGEGTKIHATKIRMFPRVQGWEPNLVNTVIQGKNTEEEGWTDLYKIEETPAENWNVYTPEDNETWEYRFYRFYHPTNHIQIAETEIIGYRYSDIQNFDYVNGQSLDVRVKVLGAEFTGTDTNPISNTQGKVTYKKDFTGKVTSIEPKMGTTIGGTELTINGTGFNKDDSTIKIDGIDCPIKANKSSTTKLVCTTGKRPTFTPSTLEIVSKSKGKVNTDGHVFLYIDRWSSENTWGGESAPREGDTVHVPKGQVLLVDVSPPPLYLVLVEGTLIFEDAKDLTFEAWFIMVRQGRLEIGTPEKPFTHNLTITMHGNRYSKMLSGFGNKGIFVQDGTIDIHGVPRTPTWTTLEKSAGPDIDGGNKITLHEDVDWKKGEEIVIAPTGTNLKEDEVHIIKKIDGRVITLESPLRFKHFAGDVNLKKNPDGSFEKLTLRAEVGLLTRNVKIQGDESTVETKHGVHILLRGHVDNCRGRYSYIEVFRAGQEFQMGRYPIHYHMIGHVHDNYVRGNAIHETFNRGTTIHGVHYLLLEKNVYHRTKGHTIFLEDGIETNNIIQDNMVVNVRKATSMLMSDLKPSGIWMARPNNYVRRNRLIGCEGNGTWFELVGHPTGPSATNEICSVKDHLMEYKANVHHSNAIGLRIYPHYFPKERPCDEVSNSRLRNHFAENVGQRAEYVDNIMYSNALGSFGKKLGRVVYINMTLISNWSNQLVSEPDNAYDQRPRNEGGYNIGKSAVGDFHGTVSQAAINFGNKSGFLVKDTHFYNFPSSSRMFSFCGGCRSEVKRTEGGKRQTFENITFQDVEAKVLNFSLPDYDVDIVRDKDGSLLKNIVSDEDKDKFKNGGWVTYDTAHLRNIPECKSYPAGQGCSHNCVICDNTINLVVAKMTVLDNYHLLAGQDLKLFNHQDGTFNKNHVIGESDELDKQKEVFGFSKFRNCQLSIGWRGWAPVVATGYKYNLHFGEGVEWKKLRLQNDYYWGPLITDQENQPVISKESQKVSSKTDAELEQDYAKYRFKPVYFSWNHTEPRELYDGWYEGLDSGMEGTEENAWIDIQTQSTPVTYDRDSNGKIKTDVDGNKVKLSKPLDDDRFTFKNSWGDYHHDSVDQVLVWKLDALKRGTLESEAIYCRETCPTEEDSNENVVYKDKTWDVAADWEIPAEGEFKGQAASVPDDDETVIIDTDWNMILNVPTKKLKKLIIRGKLTFKSDVDNLELNAEIVMIENGGQLLIGEAGKPHTLNASINLYGNKDSTYEVISPSIAPVNKAIINKGKMKIYGVIPEVTWTRLSNKISTGDGHFYIKENTQSTDWKAGDELIIASSTTQENQREKVTIDSLVNNSKEIKTKEKFEHFHYGAAAAHSTSQGDIDMRAEVGNLTRNIKIKSIDGDSWGCTILTPYIPAINSGNQQSPGAKGYLVMEGVEIKDCGQRDTAKAAIDLKYTRWENSITQSVKGCTFNNSQGWAVDIDGVENLNFVNNIIYDARKTGVFIQNSINVTFEYNLIVGIKIRENYDNIEYWDIQNAIHYNDTTSLKDRKVFFRHNSVSSSPWFGYAIPGYACDEDDSNPSQMNFFNNTAHSCKGGWFPTKIENQDCNVFANFHGYKNDEQGFQQRVDIFEVRAKNMILADNRNAFSMNGAPGKSQNYPKAHFSDSYIIGKALESSCPECYQASTECGTSGFYSALFNNAPYEFYFEETRMPLHNSTSHLFKYGGRQNLTNVVFENFNHVEGCNEKSYALRMNNFYQDNTNAIYVDKVTLKNVGDKSKIFFPNHKRHLRTPVYCGKRDCTGNYNTPFYDMDGSILGREMHYFGNNLGAGRDGDCTFFEDWNGHACNPVYAQLIMRAPADERGLVYFPLKLSIDEYEKDISSDLRFYHETDSSTEISSLIKIEKMTNLTFSQTMPSGVRYELFTAKQTDWAMFKVYSENPATMSIFTNDGRRKIKPEILKVGETLDLSKQKTKCGANYYDNKNRIMYFVLTGNPSCNVTVKLVNSLQLSTRLNIPPDEFFSSNMVTTFLDRMAALLEISIDRIRIVDIREGSTIVVTAIDSEKSAEEERSDKETVTKELQTFQDKFEEAVKEGTVDFGAEVLDVSADLAIDNVPPPSEENQQPDNPDNTTKPDENNEPSNPVEPEKSKSGMYIGIGVGISVVVIIVVCVILYFCVCKKTGASSKKTYNITNNITKEQQSIQDMNRQSYNVNKSPVLGKLGNVTRKKAIPVQGTNQNLQEYVERKQFVDKA